ncbi:MAG: hypothetical protein R2777_10475 [Chitinophagales bacterium]
MLEYIIVTPSHHRVHHAINDIYLDKTFLKFLFFGIEYLVLFKRKLENEPCVYGVKEVNTWNPYNY